MFKTGNITIPVNAPASACRYATFTTIRLSNQKYGIRGSLIRHNIIYVPYVSVISLLCRVLHTRDSKANIVEIILTYWDYLGHTYVVAEDIYRTIRRAVVTLGIDIKRYHHLPFGDSLFPSWWYHSTQVFWSGQR